MTVDLLIRQARIVDGSGAAAFTGDAAVKDGRIAAVGRRLDNIQAKETIDAAGLVLSPGFIDAHSHDDVYILVDPTAPAKVRQGVTTTVLGNCGHSPAPWSEAHKRAHWDRLLASGADLIPDELKDFQTSAGYLDRIRQAEPTLNAAYLVGHSTVREAVMGMANRPAREAELAEMKDLVAEAMAAGAAGLSSGLQYIPGAFAPLDELIALAAEAAERGGIYASHIRNERDLVVEAVGEAIEIGRRSGAPVHISHHKVSGDNNWGRSPETLALIEAAQAEGLEVTCDQYPYEACSTSLASTLPPTALAGGEEVFRPKLADPAFRADVRAEMERTDTDWENMITGTWFDKLVITRVPDHDDYIGRSVAEIAQELEIDPFDLTFDLVGRYGRGVGLIGYSMCEEDIARIMTKPYTMVGSDGSPGFGPDKVHPRMYGTFPRVLGRYVRERKILSLEEAIRKMTSLPARTFGLMTKGLIRPGLDADLVLFDPETIIDRAEYQQPDQAPEGIALTVVNGRIVWRDGRPTGVRPGRVVGPNI